MVATMFWFRSFVLGLLGACCLLLAMRPAPVQGPPLVVVATPPPACPPTPPHDPDVTVVDVAPGVTGDQIAQLIVLAGNERIVAVDDTPVTSGIATLAMHDLSSRRYIDVTVGDSRGATRRVLVLLR